jgi:Putative Ig domain
VISLSAHATDPESDTLTYAATGLPNGLSINTGTGLITGTISNTAAAGSPYSTSITVSDDNFATVGATDTFTWTVTAGGGGITFRSASSGANNVGNNVVIPAPAGVQANDVMVAVLDIKVAPTTTPPAGWNLVNSTANGSNFTQKVYTKVATGSEPADYTFTINENRAISGVIVAYSGVNTSNPVEIAGTVGSGTTTSITAPSVSSGLSGGMLIGAFGINADSTIAPPAGMTERGEIVSATRIRTEVSDLLLGAAGATGAKTATAATAAASLGQLIVLRPA